MGALTVQNSTLSGNTAGGWGKGGAIMNDTGLWVGIYPKVWRGATATITGCTITGNTASTGGGISQTSAGGSLTLTNSTITGNTATLDAGGLYINASAGGTTYLDACTLAHLANNSAPSNANSDGPYLTGL